MVMESPATTPRVGRESDDRTLYVSNLDDKVTEELLYELFLQSGPLKPWDVALKRRGDGKTGSSPSGSFAFITFQHVETVPYAMEQMVGVTLFGRKLIIKPREGGVHAEKAKRERQLMQERGRQSFEGVPHYAPNHEFDRSDGDPRGQPRPGGDLRGQPAPPGIGPILKVGDRPDRDHHYDPEHPQQAGWRDGTHRTHGFAYPIDTHEGQLWDRDDVRGSNPYCLTRRDVRHMEREARLKREEDFYGNYKRFTHLERSEAEERQRERETREQEWADPRANTGYGNPNLNPSRVAYAERERRRREAEFDSNRRKDEDWTMDQIRGRMEDTWDENYRRANSSAKAHWQANRDYQQGNYQRR